MLLKLLKLLCCDKADWFVPCDQLCASRHGGQDDVSAETADTAQKREGIDKLIKSTSPTYSCGEGPWKKNRVNKRNNGADDETYFVLRLPFTSGVVTTLLLFSGWLRTESGTVIRAGSFPYGVVKS